MDQMTKNELINFISNYEDEFDAGDLYLGAESYSIRNVDSLLHDDEYANDVPNQLHDLLADIWNDRVDGKTLLGVDERTKDDMAKIKKYLQIFAPWIVEQAES